MKLSKILIIDDEKFILKTLTDALQDVTDRILTAVNGRDGLAIACRELPDLIISDVMMPEMNGFEFLEEIRRRPETQNIPFIFLTIKDQDEDITRGYELDTDYYLEKPFKLEALLHAIDKAIFVRNKKKAAERDIEDDELLEW